MCQPKVFLLQNIQAICDNSLIIMDVVAKWLEALMMPIGDIQQLMKKYHLAGYRRLKDCF